jgi:uncharacterized protein (TIGR02678 family)
MTASDAQRAFVGLLARPLVTPASDPVLHRAVIRNFKAVTDIARRLGYRMSVVGRAQRLVRVPVAGTVTVPPAPLDAPSQRVLALTCVLAAACEDSSGGVTLARLSDAVVQLTSASTSPVTAYEPLHQAHRRQLLRAARELEHWGVLRRRTRDDSLLDEWAESQTGIGAGYDIDRDALLLLLSPDVLTAALDPVVTHADDLAATRTLRALRAIVETPAALYADMSAEDAETLRATRGLRSSDVRAFTGGYVEARAEGLVLIQPDDPPDPTTVDWPAASAVSWVALLLADLAGRAGTRRDDGTVELTDAQVDDVVEDLIGWRGEYLSQRLKDNPARVRPEGEAVLRHLGLLRDGPDRGWLLSPVAGRFRDPDQVLSDPPAPVSTPATPVTMAASAGAAAGRTDDGDGMDGSDGSDGSDDEAVTTRSSS